MAGESEKLSNLNLKIDNEIHKLEKDLESVKRDVRSLSDQVYDIGKTLDKIDAKLDFILPDLKSRLQEQVEDFESLKQNIALTTAENAVVSFKIKLIWTAVGTMAAAGISFVLKYFIGGK